MSTLIRYNFLTHLEIPCAQGADSCQLADFGGSLNRIEKTDKPQQSADEVHCFAPLHVPYPRTVYLV